MGNRSDYVDLGNEKIHYQVAGDGAPIVFLHAGFVDSAMWDDQWEEFSRNNLVIRYDMRGFGRSDAVEKPVSRRQELYRVLKEAGVERATLVGCSMGGETALDAALDCPEQVSRLVLVSTAPGGFEMQGEPPADLLQMFAALQQGELGRATELQMRLWVDGSSRQPEQVNPIVRRHAAEMSRNALAKGGGQLAFAPVADPLDPPAARRLEQVRVPTLIVAGEVDHPEVLRAADVMASAIPGARKAVISGAAHLPSMEKPGEFNRVLKDFLNM